ncbi:beta-galactosidase [Deinococcus detaillensis]|uniref:Beta-galactosidase n=1 Tax=Deinococcus detaillensis TaxID=2592048 RepID=A0A553V4P6_9DEIO|nr:beta-galactosidase [Deinococcus detaillensis]TSA87458.1 beta-galactosidase [Deinococcus detaillensis]
MTEYLQLATCDYPEHVPADRPAIYAKQQRELGLTYVRLAEFAWSRMEPRQGEFDWVWLDEAIDAYQAGGLKVVLCTPTPTPPAWLICAHPEILPYDEQGRVREFGSRRHYDFASPIYREHSRRITRAIAERYGEHPAVVGWQTDNEWACHNTGRSYGGASAAAFPAWLEAKYGSLEQLNTAWGNVFWSMEYTDWAQIKPPILLVTEPNPSHVLDYYRFCSSLIASFQAEQVAILRERSPGRFVTHNFMIFESGFDHYEVAKGLDFVSWDNYPTGMLEFFAPSGQSDDIKTHFARTGHPDLIGFNHDLYRGMLKGKEGLGRQGAGTPSGPWVMEQQCGQVNWAPFNPLPARGAVQLWTAQAWAHGVDVVSYFRWRAATMAQEVMHSGLLRHDETPDRGYEEVKALKLSDFPLGEVPAKVALLHDYDSLWLYDAQKHSASMSYWTQTVTYYMALRSLGLDVDILHSDADLSGYKVVVAPALTLISAEQARQFSALAASGTKLVFGPRTAFRTPGGETWSEGQFGPMSDLIGAKLLQYDSLRPGLTQSVKYGEGTFAATDWAESYRLSGARALASYVGGPLDTQAAVIRKGHVTVIGAHQQELIGTVLSEILMNVGISVETLPDGVRLSRRAGKTLLQNWNPHPVKWQGRLLAPVSFTVLDA